MQEEIQIVQPSQNLHSPSPNIQPQTTKPKLVDVTNTYQIKIKQTVDQFKLLTDQPLNKENGKKSFQIQNAEQLLIDLILGIWKERGMSLKTQSNILDLKLIKPKLTLDSVKLKFQPYPSIKVYYNQQILQNNNILKLENGLFYQGTLKHLSISSSQLRYEGEVNEHYQYHGKGLFKSIVDNYIYYGEFCKGLYHGNGQLKNSNNVHYIGQFENDLKSGKGVQIVMKKKKKLSDGQWFYKRQQIYEGQFSKGLRQGKGIQIKIKHKNDRNDQIYDGGWKKGEKSGEGVMTYHNGDKYSGMWENNVFHGKGTYQENGVCVYVGQFKNGKYQDKRGKMTYNNGDVYQGQFSDGKKNGNGVYNWYDGDYYDGQWKDNFPQRKGITMIGANFYDGNFLKGKRHGEGELTNQQGDVIKSIWRNNQEEKKISINGKKV